MSALKINHGCFAKTSFINDLTGKPRVRSCSLAYKAARFGKTPLTIIPNINEKKKKMLVVYETCPDKSLQILKITNFGVNFKQERYNGCLVPPTTQLAYCC